jgi:hypothetical protein
MTWVIMLLGIASSLLLLTTGYTVPVPLSGKPDVSPSNGLPDRPDISRVSFPGGPRGGMKRRNR